LHKRGTDKHQSTLSIDLTNVVAHPERPEAGIVWIDRVDEIIMTIADSVPLALDE
jgi:hypothetical protein